MLFTPARVNRRFDLFDDFFNDPFFNVSSGKTFGSMMKTDIQDNGSDYLLDVELPGFNKEDIKAELNVYSDQDVPLARPFRASLTEGESHPHGN